VILTCAACRIKYRVDPEALARPGGRTVRCASCGHTWHEASPAREREPVTVPPIDLPPIPVHAPMTAIRQYRRRGLAVGWVVLIALSLTLVLAVLVGFAVRGRVVAWWPPAARLYALAGFPAELPGAGLEFGKITPARSAEGLIIEGDIANSTGTARDVPRLRVALRDNTEKEVQFKIIDPPKARLAPGEVAHFRTPFEHPEESATGVVVTFVRP